jgi:GTP-binding protein HflX
LLHLVDAANPRFEQHIESVENILRELHLSEKPRLLVFNKIDRLDKEEVQNLELRYNAVAISALDSSTFRPLLQAIVEHIWDRNFAEVKVN